MRYSKWRPLSDCVENKEELEFMIKQYMKYVSDNNLWKLINSPKGWRMLIREQQFTKKDASQFREVYKG